MSYYKNILVALDISNESKQVLAQAEKLAACFESNISLIHVVEPVILDSNYELAPVISPDLDDNLVKRAEGFLEKLSEDAKNIKDTIVTVGSAKAEIQRVAKEHNSDLIIIGTHGRSGFAMILGSTANAILHGAPCDVLSVKIKHS